jgi:hypothetical protein
MRVLLLSAAVMGLAGCTAQEGRSLGEATSQILSAIADTKEEGSEERAALMAASSNVANAGEAIGSASEGDTTWMAALIGLATTAAGAYVSYRKGHDRGEYHAEVKRTVAAVENKS